jgi:hypothetical protein
MADGTPRRVFANLGLAAPVLEGGIWNFFNPLMVPDAVSLQTVDCGENRSGQGDPIEKSMRR